MTPLRAYPHDHVLVPELGDGRRDLDFARDDFSEQLDRLERGERVSRRLDGKITAEEVAEDNRSRLARLLGLG